MQRLLRADAEMLLGLISTQVWVQVVPEESSYPGYGDFVMLKGVDHIKLRNQKKKSDIAYVKLKDFLRNRVQTAQHQTEEH